MAGYPTLEYNQGAMGQPQLNFSRTGLGGMSPMQQSPMQQGYGRVPGQTQMTSVEIEKSPLVMGQGGGQPAGGKPTTVEDELVLATYDPCEDCCPGCMGEATVKKDTGCCAESCDCATTTYSKCPCYEQTACCGYALRKASPCCNCCHGCPCCFCNMWSLCSFCSACSFLSTLSIMSVLSFGSFLSFLSFSSTLSILSSNCIASVLSTNAIMSVGSTNSQFSMWSENSQYSIKSSHSDFSFGCKERQWTVCMPVDAFGVDAGSPLIDWSGMNPEYASEYTDHMDGDHSTDKDDGSNTGGPGGNTGPSGPGGNTGPTGPGGNPGGQPGGPGDMSTTTTTTTPRAGPLDPGPVATDAPDDASSTTTELPATGDGSETSTSEAPGPEE